MTDLEKKSWDGLTLEDVIREAIQIGSREALESVAGIIKLLPADKQAKYREIAKQELQAKRLGKGITRDQDQTS